MIRVRLQRARTIRRLLVPGAPGFVSAARLEAICKHFNTALTAIQRVENRLGMKKKPDGEAASLDKAKTLRKILDVLTGIYDVMRFTVHTHTSCIRFLSFAPMLTML